MYVQSTISSPYPTARPGHQQRLHPEPQPPYYIWSCCIFRSFGYASGYRGRRFDTGQHCFRSPIISASRFRRFVPQGILSLSLSLLCLSIPLLLRPLCRCRRQRLELPRANSLRAIERNSTGSQPRRRVLATIRHYEAPRRKRMSF